MCYFINCRSFFIALSGILFICYLSITYIDNPAFERIQQLLPSLLSLDPELIALADLSGASRINPVIYYIQDFNINLENIQVVNKIGEGSYGIVYLVQEIETNRKFVAKETKIECQSPQDQKKFFNEVLKIKRKKLFVNVKWL